MQVGADCGYDYLGIHQPLGERGIEPWAARKKAWGHPLAEWTAAPNHAIASFKAKVEPPFRALMRQFGYAKVRYRGLAKNSAHLFTLFALVKRLMARQRLRPT